MRWWQSEGEADLLQLSGGEPTIHPQIIEIIEAAKRRPIRHLMLNTNGIRIAQDPDFVEQLAASSRASRSICNSTRCGRPCSRTCAVQTSPAFAGKRWKRLKNIIFPPRWWWS